MPMHKIIQLLKSGDTEFLVLCENGSIWEYRPERNENHQWKLMFAGPV